MVSRDEDDTAPVEVEMFAEVLKKGEGALVVSLIGGLHKLLPLIQELSEIE